MNPSPNTHMNPSPNTQMAESRVRNTSGAEPIAVLPKDEARQGVTGHNVRYVLGIGLAAIIVAFGAIYFYYFGA
jgi:hypothetical protein